MTTAVSVNKCCSQCSETKPIEQFSLSRHGATGRPVYRSNCKACASARAMQWFRDHPERNRANKHRWGMSQYGITPEEYDALLAAQGGVCAICGGDEAASHGRTGTKFRLCVDHDHESGQVRGLLCQKCNRSIGLMSDNVELLRKAIDYLERF